MRECLLSAAHRPRAASSSFPPLRVVQALQDQERTEKLLLKAQASGKKVLEGEDAAKAAKERAESISKSAKDGARVARLWSHPHLCRTDLERTPSTRQLDIPSHSPSPAHFPELVVFKERRQKAFRKGIVQYTQSQIRQGRVRCCCGVGRSEANTGSRRLAPCFRRLPRLADYSLRPFPLHCLVLSTFFQEQFHLWKTLLAQLKEGESA